MTVDTVAKKGNPFYYEPMTPGHPKPARCRHGKQLESAILAAGWNELVETPDDGIDRLPSFDK